MRFEVDNYNSSMPTLRLRRSFLRPSSRGFSPHIFPYRYTYIYTRFIYDHRPSLAPFP